MKNRARQIQIGNIGAGVGQLLNNKTRRLTTSVSSTNIPEYRGQNFTPKSCYSSVRQQVEAKTAVRAGVNEFNAEAIAMPA